MTDASGTPLETLDYYPYGSTRIDQTTNNFKEQKQYIGQYNDPETNLSYLQARYYDGSKGEFLSEDPVFLADPKSQDLQNPQNLNSYSYAIDNPLTTSDPLGKHVYLVSRPIGDLGVLPASQYGAHTFVYVVPDNPGPAGSATAKPFTLSGIPTNFVTGDLMKRFNDGTDKMYAACGTVCPGFAQVSVAPPAGVSSAQFDQNVMSSYNSLPDDLGPYFFLGTPRAGAGRPNSNNAASSILMGAGVSGSQIATYGAALYGANNRWAPGLGTSATGGSSQQGLINQIAATIRTISALIGALAANKKS